ncbi:MAG: class I SAM-dependent methyltransferase [Steroidobacteraceae bacterium]
MKTESKETVADEPRSVAAVYEDGEVAASYLKKRLRFSWQRLLHERQVWAINQALAAHRPATVLELAPGPARMSVELKGVSRGVMVENSEEMIAIARARLAQAGLSDAWSVIRGNAFELGKAVGSVAFEFAYTLRFIRHFRDNERKQLYEQLRSHLVPFGWLMFDVVNGVARERVAARHGSHPRGEIPIYDACYSAAGFTREMRDNGFEVVSLMPVLRHFDLQSLVSYKFDDVVPTLVRVLIGGLERLPSSVPLEWVALCRKR